MPLNPDFDKMNGLVPAIVQDAATRAVLMLGFMNAAAYAHTHATGKVTFFSRTKNRLWTKGEESGNFLLVHDIKLDCDNDTLLILTVPQGPVCHTGADTCWQESNAPHYGFLSELEAVIADRRTNPQENSRVSQLFKKGINKIAQKVGEEAVELVIEAKDNDRDLFLNEAADLLFHYLILLQAKGHALKDVAAVLQGRHQPKT